MFQIFTAQSEFRSAFCPAILNDTINEIKVEIKGASNLVEQWVEKVNKNCYVDHVGVGICNFMKQKVNKNKTTNYMNIDPDCHRMIHLHHDNMHKVVFQIYGKTDQQYRKIRIILRSHDEDQVIYEQQSPSTVAPQQFQISNHSTEFRAKNGHQLNMQTSTISVVAAPNLPISSDQSIRNITTSGYDCYHTADYGYHRYAPYDTRQTRSLSYDTFDFNEKSNYEAQKVLYMMKEFANNHMRTPNGQKENIVIPNKAWSIISSTIKEMEGIRQANEMKIKKLQAKATKLETISTSFEETPLYPNINVFDEFNMGDFGNFNNGFQSDFNMEDSPQLCI